MKRSIAFLFVLTGCIFSAEIPAGADTHTVGILGGYGFYASPFASRGPTVGLLYEYLFLKDLGIRLTAEAEWHTPIDKTNPQKGMKPFLLSTAGLIYIIDIGRAEPFITAGGSFHYGEMGDGNWFSGGFEIGLGLSYVIKKSSKIFLELDYFLPLAAMNEMPQFLLLQAGFSFDFGPPSGNISKI